MSGAGIDRRVARTRHALQQAFSGLLLEKGWDSVDVAALVARAGIARSTFYVHYRSREDLLLQSVTPFFAAIAAVLHGSSPDLAAILRHFHGNRRLARILLSGPTRPILARLLATLDAAELARSSRQPVASPPPLPLPLVARHLAEGQLALVEAWLDSWPAVPPEVIADAIGQSARASAAALLGLPLPDRTGADGSATRPV
jgi:AcrR family transcriptional regulator